MVAVTHYNPGTREAVTTCHGPGDPDRREWERAKAVRFVAETARIGVVARHEFRHAGHTRLFRIHGRA